MPYQLDTATHVMTSTYLAPNDPELLRAWSTFEDPVEACAGEVWEYMGSEVGGMGQWVHCFRHRCHPTTHDRLYRRVQAAAGWVPPEKPAPQTAG